MIGLEEPGGGYWMPLFVHLAEGATLDEQLIDRIRRTIRSELSPATSPTPSSRSPPSPTPSPESASKSPSSASSRAPPSTRPSTLGSVDDVSLLHFYEELARTRRTAGA